MIFSRKIIALLFAFLFIPAVAAAEKMYVSDQLVITFRQGRSTEHKILKTLKTGTPVEVLEKYEGDNYVKVRLADGEEGYVLGQYLTSETPKPVIISRLEKQVEKFQDQLGQTKEKLAESSQEFKAVKEKQARKEAELSGSNSELNQALAETKKELQTVSEKYNTLLENSGKLIEITNDRDRLKKSSEKLTSEIRSLTVENSNLKRTSAIMWFLAGGGVFFFGWIIGKLSRKKQSRY